MTTRRWIRLDATWEDSEWLDDLPGVSAGCWPRLLCLVKLAGIGGRLKRPSLKALARRWRVEVADIAALEDAAINDGALLVEEGDWVLTGWDEYQQPDRTAAERMRAYRERQKQEAEDTDD